jgi:putative ABC transport system permease protein
MHDIRVAFRAIARRPTFAAVAVVTLALGIGGSAAIFSLIDSVLLQPLPYPAADRLVMVWGYSREMERQTGLSRLNNSPGDVHDYRTRNHSFQGLAWLRSEQITLATDAEPEPINGIRVSRDFFDVLGVQPVRGRTFVPEDGDGRRVVLIAESLWRRWLGASEDAVGSVVRLNNEPAVIVGVLPGWFVFPRAGDLPGAIGINQNPEVWSLDVMAASSQVFRGGKSYAMVGRLRDGVTLADAEGDMAAIAAHLTQYSENTGWTVRVLPLREQLVGGFRPALIVLLVAVGLVLLIACANVANLMLVRAAGRQREMAVRLALGASRHRLIKQLLLESLLIALAAGVVGLFIGWVGLRAVRALSPLTLSVLADARLDWRVVAFTLVVSTATGVLFGIIPAFQASRSDVNAGLREGGRTSAGGQRAHRVRNTLVVAEVALAMVLLVGATLLLQTLVRLLHVDAGFRPDGVLTMELAVPRNYGKGERIAQFYERVMARLREVPGVERAAVTSQLPLTGVENIRQLILEGAAPPERGHEPIADYRAVSPGYFELMGIPQVAGQGLPEFPTPGVAQVLITETLAGQAWPGQDPIGRRMKLSLSPRDDRWYTVIGVVGDTRHTALTSSFRPQVYVHHLAEPSLQMVVLLRAAGDPAGFAGVARATVREVESTQSVGRVRTMQEVVGDSVSNRRFTMALVATFAVLAFCLSLIGLYAVVSHSVAERTREMGLRVALGASPRSLLRLVLGEGMVLVGMGVAAGFAGSLVLTRFMRAMLYGVEAYDATTFTSVAALIAAASALGCLVPARRAMRVDPMVALRAE